MTEKYQIKKWIEKIIKSSVNWEQLTTCEKLINNFETQMKKEGYDNMLALPFTLVVTLPPAVAMVTLLFPLAIYAGVPPPDCATQLKVPEPSVLNT